MKSLTEPAVTGPRSLRDPRSLEYAIQTMQSLKRFLESKTFDAQHVDQELQAIVRHRHWEIRGFESVDAYLHAELGTGLKQLKSRLAQDLAQAVQMGGVPEAGNEKGGRPKKEKGKVYNIHLPKGTSAARIVARLKRDHPAIAARLAAGEFRSARAAAKVAGLKVGERPLTTLRRAWREAGDEDKATFRTEISQ